MTYLYYHCYGMLSDQHNTKFDLSAKFAPVDLSPNLIIKQVIDEIYSKLSDRIYRIEGLHMHLCDEDGLPLNDDPF